MAIVASPNSKANVPPPVANNKNKKKNNKKNETVSETKAADDNNSNINNNDAKSSQPAKRNSNPGVRVIGGRIYDSQNGTTCHQCRQKTYAVFVNCKNQAKSKPCNIKYCQTCLLNRYGEKVEEVALLDQWDCPKCKGVCNCSICMKRRGHQPTGMISPMAKAGGFSSVSDMIDVKGAQNVCNYKRVNETTASPRKLVPTSEGDVIKSPKKSGKENKFDGKTDTNANLVVSVPSVAEKKPKNMKRKGSEVKIEDTMVNDKKKPKNVKQKGPEVKLEDTMVNDEKKPKNVKRKGPEVKLEDTMINNVLENETKGTLNENNPKKLKSKGSKAIVVGNMEEQELKENKLKGGEVKLEDNVVTEFSVADINAALLQMKQKKPKINKSKETFEENEVKENNDVILDELANMPLEVNQCLKVEHNTSNFIQPVIPLPTGNELLTVAGVDLPKEDVGYALQLLEFCSTFGKVLDVKKGQAEAVLRDLFKGRNTRRGKCTTVIQLHIQLLSVIEEEWDLETESDSESPTSELTHGNDSWLKALKSCISKSNVKHMDDILLTAGGYDNLESSVKLRLLLFLCDEVLETEKMRNWINDQNVKFAENKKEAMEKLSLAREKERTLKQKMQDDIAKAIIKKEGVPLTIQEHDAIVSKIKKKTAEAHDEMLACKELVPVDKVRPDAVRIEPIFRDTNGHRYWRLEGCFEKPGIILQDVGTGDYTVEVGDKWFEYDDEQIELIEKHIRIMRSRFRKHCKN